MNNSHSRSLRAIRAGRNVALTTTSCSVGVPTGNSCTDTYPHARTAILRYCGLEQHFWDLSKSWSPLLPVGKKQNENCQRVTLNMKSWRLQPVIPFKSYNSTFIKASEDGSENHIPYSKQGINPWSFSQMKKVYEPGDGRTYPLLIRKIKIELVDSSNFCLILFISTLNQIMCLFHFMI